MERMNDIPKNNKCRGIAAQLHREIESGKITGKAPSENAIAKRFSISKATAAKVLAILRDSDVIETVVGSGSYIRPRTKTVTIAVQSDHTRMRSIAPAIAEHLSRRFPGVTFVFSYGDTAAADIATIVTIPDGRYDRFQPLARDMVRRIMKRMQLPAGMPLLHTAGESYALPFIVSPTFLIYNRLVCMRLGVEPSVFDGDITRLSERIAGPCSDARIAPFDASNIHLKDIMPFILEASGGREPAADDIIRGTDRFDAAVLSRRIPDASLLDGSALCKIGSRMLTADYFTATKSYDPVLVPLRVNGKPVNMLHSQSLAVCRGTADPVLAALVMEEFFSDAVQGILAGSGYGLSVTGVPARDDAAVFARSALADSRWRYFTLDPMYMPLVLKLFFLYTAGKIGPGDLSGLIVSLMTLKGHPDVLPGHGE